MIEQGWNWNEVNSSFWQEPSEDMYYFLSRWKKLGFKRFLDIGCGIGRHSLFFAKEGFDVTAFDLSVSGLTILADEAFKKSLNMNIVKGHNKSLSFSDGSFDCVLAYHSIYHTDLVGMKSCIAEIKRVLVSEGEFYLSLISKNHIDFNNPEYPLIDSNSKMKAEEDGSILPHFFIDHSEIGELLNGFELIRIRHVEDLFDDKSTWHYFIHGKKI